MDLDAATTYAVAVRGLNTARTASNWILPSPAAGLKTAAATPQIAAPEGVNAVSGDKMVTVSWEAVTGATGYRVQYRTAAQSYSTTTRMVEVAATATSAEVTGLMNGTEYMFRVTAKNAGGYGAASAEVKQTPAAMPGSLPSPTSVYLNASGRDQIVISWAHGKRADGTEDPTRIRYDVGWTDAGSGNDRFGASLSPQTILPVPGGRAATSYTLTNLKVDQSYLVAVRPVSGDAAGSTTTVGDWIGDWIVECGTAAEMVARVAGHRRQDA